ncbi:MgtC/SapB family protein [Acuticoccus mangrovi]|uniref:Protein MgtC n=1 Tax=Acuticoccus mangrovi TaxID=2796142 RepID=A0A934IT75_9HYPH|nr:MgtC/SapB family protein [Acuticoccus mangrovi]MBJ3777757.1 MgtC/SapB family protein [Acuticoccus mangrovi]
MDTLAAALSDEFLHLPGPDAIIVVLRLAGAALLCALIGFERERRRHAAGLRTNMLVGFAAATFAVISSGVIAEATSDTIRTDPLRLVEAVTSGVAFLAAGLIVFSRGEVRGLTTGATVWLSAAIGLAVGLGQWIVGLTAAVGGLVILVVLRALERRLGLDDQARYHGPRSGEHDGS